MDGLTPETCGECGFDARDWRRRDAFDVFAALGMWWQQATEGVSDDDLNRRPGPGVWSTLEYGLHISLVTAMVRAGIELVLAENGRQLPAPPLSPDAVDDQPAQLSTGSVLSALEREGEALAAVVSGRRDAAWTNVGLLPEGQVQAEAALFHAVHDATHHFMDVSRGLVALGIGTPAAEGNVAQVNTSDGGVPKRRVAAAQPVEVGWRGLAGDHQFDQKHHGRPFQAVCLWSIEVIAELAALGHPIAAGCAGENMTVAGIDWSTLRAGSLLKIGSTLIELSFPAVPCKKQTRWFTDGDFTRIAYENNPQWVRWYGWVREPGTVASGDTVTVSP